MQFDIANLTVDSEHFFSAIKIYLYKAHVVNKRVTTVRFAWALHRTDRQDFPGNYLIDKRTLIAKNPRIYHDQEEYILSTETSVEFRPRDNHSLDRKSCGIAIPAYRFEFIQQETTTATIRLTVCTDQMGKEVLWLKDVLLPKIVKWSQTNISNSTDSNTLKFISVEEYQQEYERLKVKYGKYLTENWCESTDPQKHVFEDLGLRASHFSILVKRPLFRFRHCQLSVNLLASIFFFVYSTYQIRRFGLWKWSSHLLIILRRLCWTWHRYASSSFLVILRLFTVSRMFN